MSIKAYVSSGYRWRLIIISIAALAWAAWCVNDGFFVYPRQAYEYSQLRGFEEAYPKAETPDWNELWEEHALTSGLPQDPTKIKKRSNFDIYTQYVMLAITAPIGLLYGYRALTCSSWWVEGHEEGVRAQGGHDVTWDQVTELDKTRWNKGIAYLKYDDQGSTRKVLLDNWKYEREPVNDIVDLVESRLGHDPDAEMAPPADDITSA